MLSFNYKVFLFLSIIWLGVYLGIVFFYSHSEALNFCFGLGVYLFGHLFFTVNFLLLKSLKLDPSIFFLFLLIINGVKIFLIIIFTHIIMTTYLSPNWLFFLIGLILAVKTTFYIFIPRRLTSNTLENTQ